MKTLRIAFAVSALLMPAPALAKTHALLFGVADYSGDAFPDLRGPRNDVTLMWHALKARNVAVEDMIVMTDGLPETPDYPTINAPPNASNMLQAFDDMAMAAQSGDTVIVYYFGQVILPNDVGNRDNFENTIKNAIADDLIEQKLAAIRAKGAFVWAVFDSCNSGTVTRGGDVARTISPEAFGIDPKSFVPSTSATRSANRNSPISVKSNSGDLVGFFAVESTTEAVERDFAGFDPLMVGSGKERYMGVFTNHLLRALAHNSATTFRELAQEIIVNMTGDASVAQTKLPVFDGAMDHPLPGSTGERIPESVSAILSAEGSINIPAGALKGFGTGAAIAIYDPAQPKEPIATAMISADSAVTSEVTEITWNKDVTPLPPGRVAVVMTSPAINYSFTLAPPPPEDYADENQRQQIQILIEKAFANSSTKLGLDIKEEGTTNTDMVLRVKENRIWLTRRDKKWITEQGAFDETPSLALSDNPETSAPALRNNVWILARAAKLVRLATAVSSSAEADEDGITITATMSKDPAATSQNACAKTQSAAAMQSPLEPLVPVPVGNCDTFEVTVTNESDQDYYVSGFYVEALGAIVPRPGNVVKSGCVRTLASDPEKPLTFRFSTDIWDEANNRPFATGAESFVLLAVPKDKSNQPPAFCDLVQNSIDVFATRGDAAKSPMNDLLKDISGSATRSAGTESASLTMTSRVFMLNVAP
jgi:Caspase domain